jgi:hypothetical protein
LNTAQREEVPTISEASGTGTTALESMSKQADVLECDRGVDHDQGNGNNISVDRCKAVDAYIEEVFRQTQKRVTRTDIWKSARYKSRTEFERWERNDPRATKTANQRFSQILFEKPHLK